MGFKIAITQIFIAMVSIFPQMMILGKEKHHGATLSFRPSGNNDNVGDDNNNDGVDIKIIIKSMGLGISENPYKA